jgi:putative sigma-54 modulation protein
VVRKFAQENKITEIKISILGKHLFAKKKCDTVEQAAVEALEATKRKVTKHKGKVFA